MRKQKFKGKVLLKGRLVNNIIRVYKDDTFDFNSDWYKEASKLANSLSNSTGVNYLKVCGIIAALSPLKAWSENKKIAVSFLTTGEAKHTRRMTDKAKAILVNSEGATLQADILEILNGNKIQNFFINIAEPTNTDAVTIDRHALAVALNRSISNKEGIGVTDVQYKFFKDAYLEAAELLGTRGSMVQSITWEKWRELKKVI